MARGWGLRWLGTCWARLGPREARLGPREARLGPRLARLGPRLARLVPCFYELRCALEHRLRPKAPALMRLCAKIV